MLFKANLVHVLRSYWTVFRVLQGEYEVKKLDIFLVSSPLLHNFHILPEVNMNLSSIS